MQLFSDDATVLVCRKASYSKQFFKEEQNFDSSLIPEDCMVGYVKIPMLLLADKVLVYNTSKKSFLWYSDTRIFGSDKEVELIKFNSRTAIGGSGFSDRVTYTQVIPETSLLMYSIDDGDIQWGTAREVFDLLKSNFYVEQGGKSKTIYNYLPCHDMENYQNIVNIRKVPFNFEACEQVKEKASFLTSLNIDENYVLIQYNSAEE
jgi:hypothetical protein